MRVLRAVHDAGPRLRLSAFVVALSIVCFLLARYFSNPVKSLRTAVRRSASGDLEQHVGSKVGARRDELGELARDFRSHGRTNRHARLRPAQSAPGHRARIALAARSPKRRPRAGPPASRPGRARAAEPGRPRGRAARRTHRSVADPHTSRKRSRNRRTNACRSRRPAPTNRQGRGL
ncbi:MAG: HAMP domain-containing protein [Planctomycetes bacterium]|nr:HAMP domain-containing protein [Planctomycetota bacterium]